MVNFIKCSFFYELFDNSLSQSNIKIGIFIANLITQQQWRLLCLWTLQKIDKSSTWRNGKSQSLFVWAVYYLKYRNFLFLKIILYRQFSLMLQYFVHGNQWRITKFLLTAIVILKNYHMSYTCSFYMTYFIPERQAYVLNCYWPI